MSARLKGHLCNSSTETSEASQRYATWRQADYEEPRPPTPLVGHLGLDSVWPGLEPSATTQTTLCGSREITISWSSWLMLFRLDACNTEMKAVAALCRV